MIKRAITAIKHLWQRNFGRVYLKDKSCLGDGLQYIFRCRFKKVAMVWNNPYSNGSFICKLGSDGKILNVHDRAMSGYGKQYGGWIWSYDPLQPGKAERGGAW